MGRPRRFVNRHGKEVKTNTGVSFHKPTGCYYILDHSGRRRYFKAWESARAALALASAAHEPHTTIMVREADYGPTLYPPDPNPTLVVLPSAHLWAELARMFEAEPQKFIDRLPILDYLRRSGMIAEPVKGEGPTLERIGEAWKESQLAKHGEETQHVRETLARWQRFCKVVGGRSRRVDTLTAKDFREYHAAVARTAAQEKKSAKWYNNTCVAPKLVLNRVVQRYPELKIPADVVLWSGSFDPRAYQAKRTNRTPVTPDEFSALIAACRKWAATDPSKIDATTQSGRSRRLHAKRKRRAGVQMEAALRLGLNCALDPIDLERIAWADLKLDNEPPYMDFARRKAAKRVGEAVTRCTPLLPATVEALRAWQRFEGRRDGLVFLTAAKGPFTSERTCRAFNRLKADVGLNGGVSFKHLRNAAPTIAYRTLRSRDLADMVLGHQISSEARKYVGDPTDPTVLLDLVRAVGRVYNV